MLNDKIPMKDIALSRLFLEPFKWDSLLGYRGQLGSAADLLT